MRGQDELMENFDLLFHDGWREAITRKKSSFIQGKLPNKSPNFINFPQFLKKLTSTGNMAQNRWKLIHVIRVGKLKKWCRNSKPGKMEK